MSQPPIMPGYPQQPHQPDPLGPPTAAPRTGWRTPIVIVLVAFALGVGLCVGGVVGASGGDDKAKPAATVHVTVTARPAGSSGTGAAVAPTTAKPATTITDEGVLLVPSEVRPGTYRATVPADSYNCYWARLSAPQDDFASVIANGNGQSGTKMTVTIRSTDKAFKTEGCGTWVKIG